MARRAVEAAPLKPTWHWHLAVSLLFNKQAAEALDSARRALELDPSCWPAAVFEGGALVSLGEVDAGLRAIERAVTDSGRLLLPLTSLGEWLAHAGRKDEARLVLAELVQRAAQGTARASQLSDVYLALGEQETALEWLARAVDQHDPMIGFSLRGPWAHPLRSHPTFVAIEGRVFG